VMVIKSSTLYLLRFWWALLLFVLIVVDGSGFLFVLALHFLQ
jgi:hypothetical protein